MHLSFYCWGRGGGTRSKEKERRDEGFAPERIQLIEREWTDRPTYPGYYKYLLHFVPSWATRSVQRWKKGMDCGRYCARMRPAMQILFPSGPRRHREHSRHGTAWHGIARPRSLLQSPRAGSPSPVGEQLDGGQEQGATEQLLAGGQPYAEFAEFMQTTCV
jgi:hypothetical protein